MSDLTRQKSTYYNPRQVSRVETSLRVENSVRFLACCSIARAVPGAEVKITQTDTGLMRTTVTGTAGGYVLPDLPVGPYQLEVSKSGFSRYVQAGIVLQVASNPTVDVSLKMGTVS